MILVPNFFVVGTGKAGTTSLYFYLKQHPEIYLSPVKEPHYFAKDIYEIHDGIDLPPVVTDFQEYLSLFKGVRHEKAVGEMSTTYLYSRKAAIEIKKFNPNARIIIILRNPIERAYSHYLMNLRDGIIAERDFLKAIRIRPLYIKIGLYYEQVKRYLECFSEENVKIFLYEDYKNCIKNTLKEIFQFLEVDTNFLPDITKRYNIAATPKYPILNRLVRDMYLKIKDFLPEGIKDNLKEKYKKVFLKKEKKVLLREEKEILLRYFKDDIEKLSKLINRNLSIWMKIDD